MPVDSPVHGLAIDPQSGGPIQNTCFGEDQYKWIPLRLTSDGTVSNTATLVNNQIDSDGLIDVSAISVLGLIIDYDEGSAPLTHTDILLRYTDSDNSIEASDTYVGMTISGGINTFSYHEKKIRLTATDVYIITQPVANAKYLKIYVQSSGTVTGSNIGIWLARGWGTGFHFMT